MKSVGVIGGLGPETTAEFYISVIRKSTSKVRPRLLIHNVPMPLDLEEDIVKNSKNEEGMLPLLLNGLKILQDKVDFIVIPCNTAHIFIENVRKESRIPVMSIIEEVVDKAKSLKLKRLGILATTKTIESKMFDSKLIPSGMIPIIPNETDQRRVSEIIHMLLQGVSTDKMKNDLLTIVNGLHEKDVDAIILGCTDLQLLLKQKDSPVKLLDTMEVLAESTVEMIRQ